MFRRGKHRSAAAEDLLGPQLNSRADVEKLLAGLTALYGRDESRARRDLRANLDVEDRQIFDAFAPKRSRGRPPGSRAKKPNHHLLNEMERRFYRELVPSASDRAFAVFALKRAGRTDVGTRAFKTAVDSLLRRMRDYRGPP